MGGTHTSRRPRPLRRTWAVVAAFVAAASCAAPGGFEPDAVASSDTSLDDAVLVVGLKEPVATLDPADHRSRVTETVIRNMFDGLVTRDTRSGVHLELASAIDVVDDTTIVVTLREGVLFHDGVEMTADDVVFTFERIMTEDGIEYPVPHTSPRKSLLGPLASVRKTGPYEVTFTASAPWPVMIQLLVHQQIVPKHYLEAVGSAGFVAHPIGTGPFAFVSASGDGEHVVMERFDDYWGGAPDLEPVGDACVSRVVFRSIADPDERIAALVDGEVDLIQGVPVANAGVLEEVEYVDVYAIPSTSPMWIDLNVTRPPFDDRALRQAITHAVDRTLVSEVVFGGWAEPLTAPLSPHNPFAHPGLPSLDVSTAHAQGLFTAAGWVDSDGDGVLDKDGQPLAFTLDTLFEFTEVAELVRGLLAEFGVRVEVVPGDRLVLADRFASGDGDALLADWGDSAFDPMGHFEAKWHTREMGTAYGRGNYSGFSDARVDELIRLGEMTADPGERLALYLEAQEILWEEAPAVFLVLPPVIEAASQLVERWEPAMDGRINLHDVCLASD